MFYELKYTFLSNFWTKKQTPIKILKSYYSHNNYPMFFNVNDVVVLAITGDYEQSGAGLPQTNYVDDLAYVFMDQRNKSKLKKRSGRDKPE